MATITFGRPFVLGLVAAHAQSVSLFKIPFLVRREIGVLVAGVARIICLVLCVGEHSRLLAFLGL